ncbi:MAG: tyrosine-type recombinase/integrase [Prevotella sp.]|nr:tyrosine-type recombinase/integrase [Prevotella sp.]
MIYNKFIQYISVERRLSVKTIETYASTLKLFKDFLEMLPEARTLETADSDNIRDWMEQLMEQKCSPAYVNRSLAALRTFYKYCYATGVMMKDPARSIVGPKRAKRLPRFLKENEIDRLVDLLSNGEMTFDNVRTRTIIYMLYLTGLRAAELISLDDNMISFVNRELKVTGKRNKQRVIPFGEELHSILSEYITVRNNSIERKDDALFVGDKGERITYNKVRKLVKETLPLVSSLDKCTPHVLRHTFATTMLNHDANLESIKKLLGHQSLNTTEVYTHTTFEQLKKIYKEAHPRE